MSTQAVSRFWSYETAWLSGAKFDLTFILGVLVLALFSGFIVWNDPSLFAPVVFLDVWFLGYHHVIATFTKLGGTPQDRAENKFLIYYLPFIVVGAVAVLGFTVGVWSIFTIYFFWQWYHYTRQSYGISIFYRRKSETPIEENHTLFLLTLWSIPVWGVLNRCYQGWDSFLFNAIWMPQVPLIVVALAATGSICLLTYWVITRLIAFRNGNLPLGQTLFMLSHFTAFYVGYILIPDINIGWLVANIWHNAQYILFVWLYNTKRFGHENADKKTVVGWASQTQPVRIMVYFAGCLLLTTAIYGTLTGGLKIFAGHEPALLTTLYVVAFQTLNFHHYIVDSIIWKARKKQHQKVMNLKDVK